MCGGNPSFRKLFVVSNIGQLGESSKYRVKTIHASIGA